MDDLNSSSICAVLDSGIYIVIRESIEKISTAATHFWIGNGKRVFVPWCIPVQPAWAALMLLCKMLFLCEASGSLRVLREKPEAGLIKRGFFSWGKIWFCLGSGGQRESVVKRTPEAVISFCYKMGILSPLFQAYPPHTLGVKWLGVLTAGGTRWLLRGNGVRRDEHLQCAQVVGVAPGLTG